MSSTIRLSYLPGLTLTGVLRDVSSATTLATLTFTEDGTEDGEYTATTTEINKVCTIALISDADKVADMFVKLGADAGTYRAGLLSTFDPTIDNVTVSSMTSGALNSVAAAVENSLLNESDGREFLQAISDTVGSGGGGGEGGGGESISSVYLFYKDPNSDFNYRGGYSAAAVWVIEKVDRTDDTTTSASLSNNTRFVRLQDAWAYRFDLTYA